MKYFATLILISFIISANSQGHIEHIKNQSYLKGVKKVNCNDPLYQRICANLEFQQKDSVLTVYYKQLGKAWNPVQLDEVQKKWRNFRDSHCDLAYKVNEMGAGDYKYVVYLNCLTELTNHRIVELKSALENK